MGTEYLATPTGTFSFTPTFVRFASIENPSERTRDISVPDTIAIGGRVTSTDSQLSRTAVVALQIRPVGGSPQEVFCVRTRVGVPWIKEGLDAARTYEVTPNALLAVAQRRGIVVEDHIELGLFGPPFVRVQGPKTDVNFTVSFDRVPGGIVQRSPCEP
jgi:hypothetical protein